MSRVGGCGSGWPRDSFYMNYFKDPVFDLLKLGQKMKKPVTRHSFARHVVDLGAKLALQVVDAKGLNQSRELLHDQIASLSWKNYFWFIPTRSFRMDYSIYPSHGHEDVLPYSLLGTSLLYRYQLNSSDPETKYYTRLMVRTGLEWACYMGQHEGKPNAFGDMTCIDCNVLNTIFPTNSSRQ
jgi:hypothetical protein